MAGFNVCHRLHNDCAAHSKAAAGERAAEALQEVKEEDAGIFLQAADTVLAGMDAREALARALVQLTGHTSLQVGSCFALASPLLQGSALPQPPAGHLV